MDLQAHFEKKRKELKNKINILNLQLAKVEGYFETGMFPKINGKKPVKKAEKTPEKDEKESSGWI